MKLHLIDAKGVHKSEIEMIQRIEKTFSAAEFSQGWVGFAGVKLWTGQPGAGDLDCDFVLVTHDGIALIELKNVTGKVLESRGEEWFIDGALWKRRSPVKINNNKARILKTLIEQRLPGVWVWVHPFVVFNETIDEMQLADPELDCVLRIDEMLAWTDRAQYEQWITRPARVSPLKNLAVLEKLFQATKSRPRDYTIHGYRPDPKPLWEHPKKLYAEYRAKEVQDPDKLALVRQWDFGTLGSDLIGENERGFIALREQRVYEYVESKDEELLKSLLRPVSRQSEADVTRDFVELFVLPPKVTRLTEFANSSLPKLNASERVVMLKALLQRFAVLHEMTVAHRDLGEHCLWVDRPAKVIVSGLAAAHYPQMATLAAYRERVKVERSQLPEDIGLTVEGTAYQRDVYSLGVLGHLFLFGERPPKVGNVYQWVQRADDSVGGAVSGVLKRALDSEPGNRFADAAEMLAALNAATQGSREQVIDLRIFDAFQAQTRGRDYPQVGQAITDDEHLLAYQSSKEGIAVLVKEWAGVRPDDRDPELCIRLLSFLERARNLKLASLKGTVPILDFGLTKRGELLLVQKWVDGVTLTKWMAGAQAADSRLRLARSMVRAVTQLHDFEWPHGDIKPDNVIVKEDGTAVFVDLLDFRRSSADVYSTAFLPPQYKSMRPVERDRYSLALVLQMLLKDPESKLMPENLQQVDAELRQLIDGLGVATLEPLAAFLEGDQAQEQKQDLDELALTVQNLPATGIRAGSMLSDNGYFYLSIENDRQVDTIKRCRITGVAAELSIEWSTERRRPVGSRVTPIDMTQLKQRRASCFGRFAAQMRLVDGPRSDFTELYPTIEGWIEAFSEQVAEEVEQAESHTAALTTSTELVGQGSPAPGVDARQLPDVAVAALWRALLDAEQEALPTATVSSEPYKHPSNRGQVLIPCVLEGVVFDPETDEPAWVEREVSPGTWFRLGDLELRDSDLRDPAILAVDGIRGKPPRQGDKLRLRGMLESSSLNKRSAAVGRILSGKAVIPNLVDYFDTSSRQPDPIRFSSVSEEALQVYAHGERGLKDGQLESLRKALEVGPISLLQGPPGTGKTTFIACVLHYLVTCERARRILVVSQSHEAVNNALEKGLSLFESMGLEFDAVRLGNESVVSDSIRHLHSASIEQAYRERFKAEYDDRIARLATDLGLPEAFARSAAVLHRSLGRLAVRIEKLNAAVSEVSAVAGSGDAKEARPDVDRLMSVFDEIALDRYSVRRGDSQPMEVVDDQFAQLAEEHEIDSPTTLQRLRDLLKLSDDWLKALGEPSANFTEFLAKSRAVVAGTLVGIGRRAEGVINNIYDWVIIDEAGRATPSELAVALQTGRRILLVGDHAQLPPTYTDEVKAGVMRQLGLRRERKEFASDFERLFDSGYGGMVGTSLRRQYRMAPTIGQVVSDVFYTRSPLSTGRGPSKLNGRAALGSGIRAELNWVDTTHWGRRAYEQEDEQFGRWNEAEADVAMRILHDLFSDAELMTELRSDLREGEPLVGVICMYDKQRDLINRRKSEARWLTGELRKLIKVDTVDGYQGKENKIVILSTVRNNPRMDVGFLKSPNRVNVAMSRAQERLVVIGATRMWRDRNQDMPLGRVLSAVERLTAEGRAAITSVKEVCA